MAKVILLCGKIGSGKSTYVRRIQSAQNCVVLSCDEVMLSLFDEQLGDKHAAILAKVKDYLYGMAQQIVLTGVDVILDFGFFGAVKRGSKTKAYFSKLGIQTYLIYIRTTPKMWEHNIEQRNRAVRDGKVKAYYIDDVLKEILSNEFQEPHSDEIDEIIDNKGQ